jgi:hypothetical protein
MIWWMVYGCGSTFYSKDEQELTKCSMFSIGDGSGQIVAQALFDNLKDKDREFTLAQGSLIAYRLIKEAMNSSPEVGKFVDICTIKDNVRERKTEKDLKELNLLFKKWISKEQEISESILASLR